MNMELIQPFINSLTPLSPKPCAAPRELRM